MNHESQLLRGRPLSTALRFFAGAAIVIALALGVSIWINRALTRRAIAEALAFLTLAAVLSVALAVVAYLTTARIDHERLRFTFCGIPTASIPLRSITGYERTSFAIRIFFDGRWTAPNNLLDKRQLAQLLEVNGVPERFKA